MGLAVAAAAYVGVRVYFDRLRARLAVGGPPIEGPPAVDPRSRGVADPSSGTDSGRPELPAAKNPTTGNAPGVPGRGASGSVRLAQRVLVHLARTSVASKDGRPSPSATQRGIGATLGVSQGALSGVLRRLEDGGAVVSEKAHVPGVERRVNVYVLTHRGQELVRAVQAAAPASRSSGAADADEPDRTPAPAGRPARRGPERPG